jgi:hypothetical protein
MTSLKIRRTPARQAHAHTQVTVSTVCHTLGQMGTWVVHSTQGHNAQTRAGARAVYWLKGTTVTGFFEFCVT